MNSNNKDSKNFVTVYHYCRAEDWRGIVQGSDVSKGQPGLAGQINWIQSVELEEFGMTGVFAFLEPLPDSWIKNKYFGDLLWKKNKMGEVLLEIRLNLEEDTVFVCEKAYKLGFIYNDKNLLPNEYISYTAPEAERAYLKTKVALKDYVENHQNYSFLVPEVVVLHNIPFDRIKVSKYQPLIEEKLKKYNGKVPKSAFTDINKIGELKEWLEDYTKRHPFKLVEEKFDILDFL